MTFSPFTAERDFGGVWDRDRQGQTDRQDRDRDGRVGWMDRVPHEARTPAVLLLNSLLTGHESDARLTFTPPWRVHACLRATPAAAHTHTYRQISHAFPLRFLPTYHHTSALTIKVPTSFRFTTAAFPRFDSYYLHTTWFFAWQFFSPLPHCMAGPASASFCETGQGEASHFTYKLPTTPTSSYIVFSDKTLRWTCISSGWGRAEG